MQRERIIRVSNYDRTDNWMGYYFTLVGIDIAGVRNKYGTDAEIFTDKNITPLLVA